MNAIVTSREAILSESRKIVMEHGISAINIRTVANACRISVGSLYNYFPSKTDLISAIVENIWQDIFSLSRDSSEFSSFTDCLLWLFGAIKKGCTKYPGFFTFHSMSFAAGDKEKGRKLMEQYFLHMKKELSNVLEQDSKIRPNAFNNQLSKDGFVEFIFTVFTAMLLKEEDNCEALLEIVKRCIY